MPSLHRSTVELDWKGGMELRRPGLLGPVSWRHDGDALADFSSAKNK